MKRFEAMITRDGDAFVRDVVRLRVFESLPRAGAFLMPDGTWKTVGEGEAAGDNGLVLPSGAVEAIAVAIQEWQGHASHADTEARVLREALDVERGRVDRMLAR